jgi:hypothetical protein
MTHKSENSFLFLLTISNRPTVDPGEFIVILEDDSESHNLVETMSLFSVLKIRSFASRIEIRTLFAKEDKLCLQTQMEL